MERDSLPVSPRPGPRECPGVAGRLETVCVGKCLASSSLKKKCIYIINIHIYIHIDVNTYSHILHMYMYVYKFIISLLIYT